MAGSLQHEEMDQLEQWIGTGPKDFQLLYSAKRDGCVAKTFHQRCDNQGPTVTVLYNDQNCVFRGYASQSWQTATSGHISDGNAFLFQLRFNGVKQANKFPVKNASRAIYNYYNYGPLFGDDDLYTFTGTIPSIGGCFQLNGNMTGTSYNLLDFQVNQINSGSLKVSGLEVYAVVRIPQIVLLTKIDKICSLVEENVSTVFKSEKVKVAVEKVSQTFGVLRGNVVPVKNYENEIQLDTSISILALLALRQMLHFSEDYLGNCLQKMETENLQKMNIRD